MEYHRNNPFLAKIIRGRPLTHPSSEKVTLHIELDIKGSGFQYAPGDAIGIYPSNEKSAVEKILKTYGWTGTEVVSDAKGECALENALEKKYSLGPPSRLFLVKLREHVQSSEEQKKLDELLAAENKAVLEEYLGARDVIDLANEFPSAMFEPQTYVNALKRLHPRLYSVASSSLVYPDSVHLTVGVVRYTVNEKEWKGVTSSYLVEGLGKNETSVPIFHSPSHFKLPEDLSKDIIMVGPGTGIAPFRGFLQEYIARAGTGRMWLFFGERHEGKEFLYKDELLDYRDRGHLHRLDLAFSRDQEHKIYVQHKMKEQASVLWEWIQRGAYFYVCGDAQRMAKAVESEFLNMLKTEGHMDMDQAMEYLKNLKKEKRYQKDVY